jgi:hypothetical protein
MDDNIIPGSFRDPCGFIFRKDQETYRQINQEYRKDYDLLLDSGLYKALTEAGLLIAHEEVDIEPVDPALSYRIIKPCTLPFISYPYEWCFSQLKEAALTTLRIQKKALESGMSLRDSSAYNIQFFGLRPVFIDTLSFEKYQEGAPWVAYRQFCQHFLAPLALASRKDPRANQLLKGFLDGIPLDMADNLLGLHSRLNLSLLYHIHLHARAQKNFARKGSAVRTSNRKMSKFELMGLIDSLESAVMGLSWQPKDKSWATYYDKTDYSALAFKSKKEILERFLGSIKPDTVWDLGANTGLFSRIAASHARWVVSFDMDYAAAQGNYLECVKNKNTNILPLVMDMANPSPAIGWENAERMSLLERSGADCVLALALLHHLAIANNLPLIRIAEFFSRISRHLIIEFVPKSDVRLKQMLIARKDVFSGYDQKRFEEEFRKYFSIESRINIDDSARVLYLMDNLKR